MKLETFNDVLKSMESNTDRTFHLLLGNGFSMSYDPDIFSYNALHDFITDIDDELLSKLFSVIKTKNFELIMQQLDTFATLLDAFGSETQLKIKVEQASAKLKNSLISAVKALHPEHVVTVSEESCVACATFLKPFLEKKGSIYTTNYDLLLYWVLMRSQEFLKTQNIANIDGFGREQENPNEYISENDAIYSDELSWGKYKNKQNIYYVHGALPLFDTGVEIIKEVYDKQNYLLENISKRMDKSEYPIFVTAGNGREKLTHIMHNRYLSNCYENLSNITGSLVVFGFNFGEYDEHIIDAINIAAKHKRKVFPKLLSIYIGVYSDTDKKHIEKIESKFKCKVHIFDAKTAHVWR